MEQKEKEERKTTLFVQMNLSTVFILFLLNLYALQQPLGTRTGMKYCNRLADVGPARLTLILTVHRRFRQEPRGTDEPVWLPSFFSLWFGDYTGRRLPSFQKNKAPRNLAQMKR